MDIELRTITGCGEGFTQALEIRQKVFVLEQQVPLELERDEFDEAATHVLLLADGIPVGTGRIFADSDQADTARLGRVAVLKEYRGLKFGQVLIARLLDEIRAQPQFRRVLIHAQTSVVELYARFGFEKIGEEFYEAGIAHYTMVCRLRHWAEIT